MANKHAAEKAIRQSARHQVRNRVIRATARTQVKNANKLVAEGNSTDAEQSVKAAISALDKAAQKGIIKKNNAARRKSRLVKKLNKAKAAKG
ncbi:MAG: 30S ribosomal protein S20 [Chloroflexi bacterium]|nr:30S ribosomal protein S20 [Chloroflexota bacterium]